MDSPAIARPLHPMLPNQARRDTVPEITLALVVLVIAFAHMLIDGNCDTGNTGFAGPSPNDARACARIGGTWTQSTGFMHVAYEIGHVGFWPVIVLLVIAAAILISHFKTLAD